MIMTTLRINMDEVDAAKLFQGKKGTYLNLTIAVNDKTDRFGNNVKAWHEQSKEERDAKVDRIHLGEGKVFFEKVNTEGYKKPFNSAPKESKQDSTPEGFE